MLIWYLVIFPYSLPLFFFLFPPFRFPPYLSLPSTYAFPISELSPPDPARGFGERYEVKVKVKKVDLYSCLS